MSETMVFVVDDDPSVRNALARLIRALGWRPAAFPSARSFLEFLESTAMDGPACVILDVQMPEMSGPQMQAVLNEKGLSLPIIFLTGHGDLPTGVEAMKRGAVDFLEKPVDDQCLIDTIRAALAQHRLICERTTAQKALSGRLARLSCREREVMTYVVGGWLNKQIAGELGIAEKTVKVHRGRIMEKLQVRSLAELIRLCDAARIEPCSRRFPDSAASKE